MRTTLASNAGLKSTCFITGVDGVIGKIGDLLFNGLKRVSSTIIIGYFRLQLDLFGFLWFAAVFP